MLPYRFALIVSPFSNKHCKRPLGNYWGSPWELFPASLIRGMQGIRHLPRITCSQIHGAHRWPFPEVDAKKQVSEGHGNSLVTAANGSGGGLRVAAGLWETKQHVWFWNEKPKCLSKAHWTSLSTQFYGGRAIQRCCESFISAWLIISSPGWPWKFSSRQGQKSKFILASSTLFLLRGCSIYYFLQLFPHVLPL